VVDTVVLSVVSGRAPGEVRGQRTEFGLQDKKRFLRSGEPASAGLAFRLEVPVVVDGAGGTPRFRGPYVHAGSGRAQHLYLGWRYIVNTGMNVWINRLRIHLDITRDQVAAARESGGSVEVDASGPQWGVLKDWHGLNVGRVWTVSA
jgi:hypothetical protein